MQPGQPPLVDKQTWAGDPAFGDFIRFLADTALSRGMEITSCAETIDLRPYGIRPGKCVDDDLLRRLFGIDVPAKKDPSQRPQCKLRAQQGHRRLQYVSVRLPILLRHSRLEAARRRYARTTRRRPISAPNAKGAGIAETATI